MITRKEWESGKVSRTFPRHDFSKWLLMDAPGTCCDAPDCEQPAWYMLPQGEATFFACEGHMLAGTRRE